MRKRFFHSRKSDRFLLGSVGPFFHWIDPLVAMVVYYGLTEFKPPYRMVKACPQTLRKVRVLLLSYKLCLYFIKRDAFLPS